MTDGLPAPDPYYYLSNFRLVLSQVWARYHDLFHADELATIESFESLSADAQRLYVRLYLRVGPVFRRARLAYAEIANPDAAIDELDAAGFTSDAADVAPQVLLGLLRADELRHHARQLGLDAVGRKPALVERLLPAAAEVLAGERFVAIQRRELFDIVRLLFFGNLSQDLSEFVLVNIRQVAYPRYELVAAARLFPERRWLDAYLQAFALRLLELDQLPSEMLVELASAVRVELDVWPAPASYRRRIDPGRSFALGLLRIARELERRGCAEEAMASYALVARRATDPGARTQATDRLGLVAQRAGATAPFAEAVSHVLGDGTLDAIARYTLERRRALAGLGADPREKLRTAIEIELDLEPAGHRGGKALYLNRAGDPVWIELAALELLGDGEYSENVICRALFGLLFWDVIFAPVPGVFQHQFHDAPLDAGSEQFYVARRDLIEARLAQLARVDLGAEVCRAWDAHRGERCAFVYWEGCERDVLARCARLMGGRLAGVLDHLARHPKRHGHGLPDLLLWDDDDVRFVEVKGPGDQLLVEQRLWHDVLLGCGFDVKVARVRRRGDGDRSSRSTKAVGVNPSVT